MSGFANPQRPWSDDDRLSFLRDIYRRIRWGRFTMDPLSVPANSTVDTTVTGATGDSVSQLREGQHVTVTPPSTLESGLAVGGAWCPDNGQITVRLANVTGSPINPASATWTFSGVLI